MFSRNPWLSSNMKQSTVCTKECVLHTYENEASAYDDASVGAASTACYNSLDQAALAEQLYGPIYDWEIRVLALTPGQLGSPLEARMHLAAIAHDSSVVLHDARLKTKYEALSYCWGRPVLDHLISCNEVDYPITRSLYQALQRLRLEDEVRYLWVDQLCINQHNVSERSVQVRKMLLTYQSARRVLVWLGEAGPHTGEAIYTTIERCQRMQDKENMIFALDVRTLQLCRRHFEAFVHGVRDLLSRPWYNRLWILQEIWGARDIDTYCGPNCLPMGDLERLAKAFTEYTKDLEDPFLRLTRQNSSSDHKEELIMALQRASASECSDVRDRIYGVLGICRDPRYVSNSREGFDRDPPVTFEIDYGRNASQVYEDVMEAYVNASAGPAIFMLLWAARCSLDDNTIFGGQVNGYRIPSWCPNFSMPWNFGYGLGSIRKGREFTSYMQMNRTILRHRFTVETKREEDRTYIDRSSTFGILHVRGVQLARVGDAMRNVESMFPHDPSETICLDRTLIPLQRQEDLSIIIDSTLAINSSDIIVAVDGSLVLWILRHSKDMRYFTFVGVAPLLKDLIKPKMIKSLRCYELLKDNAHRFEEFMIE